jgi:hypothetical protein
MENLIASTTGIFVAEISTIPICTIKTNYQVNSGSIKDNIKQIYSRNGFWGFYRASLPGIASQIVSTGLKYSLYQKMNQIRPPQNQFERMQNGCIGGIGGALLSHPIDVWKNYAQRGEKLTLDFKKLYSGLSQSLIKTSVLYTMLFPTYDFYREKTGSSFIAAPLTTLTVSGIIQPIDYLKVRWMAGNFERVRISELYRGYFLMIARSIPHFMIGMWVTEKIKESIS